MASPLTAATTSLTEFIVDIECLYCVWHCEDIRISLTDTVILRDVSTIIELFISMLCFVNWTSEVKEKGVCLLL